MNIFLFSYISIDNILASEIIFTVNTIGPYFIINPYFSPLPNSVFVNNTLREDCQMSCNITLWDKIKLQFDDDITSCENMFKDLFYITEIDLSNFDFSHVTSMNSMFNGCNSLVNINFGNIIYFSNYPIKS